MVGEAQMKVFLTGFLALMLFQVSNIASGMFNGIGFMFSLIYYASLGYLLLMLWVADKAINKKETTPMVKKQNKKIAAFLLSILESKIVTRVFKTGSYFLFGFGIALITSTLTTDVLTGSAELSVTTYLNFSFGVVALSVGAWRLAK